MSLTEDIERAEEAAARAESRPSEELQLTQLTKRQSFLSARWALWSERGFSIDLQRGGIESDNHASAPWQVVECYEIHSTRLHSVGPEKRLWPQLGERDFEKWLQKTGIGELRTQTLRELVSIIRAKWDEVRP